MSFCVCARGGACARADVCPSPQIMKIEKSMPKHLQARLQVLRKDPEQKGELERQVRGELCQRVWRESRCVCLNAKVYVCKSKCKSLCLQKCMQKYMYAKVYVLVWSSRALEECKR